MSRAGKIAPEQLPVLFVKNLNYDVEPQALFKLFNPGDTKIVRQIRQGISDQSKGTAVVVFWNAIDAKNAIDKLNGYNFQNRYLVVLWYQPEKTLRARDVAPKEEMATRYESLARAKQEHGIA